MSWAFTAAAAAIVISLERVSTKDRQKSEKNKNTI
jgi:hypothetical protein